MPLHYTYEIAIQLNSLNILKSDLHAYCFSPIGMLVERAIYFTSSLSLQLVYFRRC